MCPKDQLFTTLLWLLLLLPVQRSAPHSAFPVTAGGTKTQFGNSWCSRATARRVLVHSGACAREVQGAVPAGSSLHRSESGFEEWPWTERPVAYLVCSREYEKGMSSSWEFQSGGLYSRYKAVSGPQAAKYDRFPTWEEGYFLLGEAAETHFVPVLCCGPSLQVTEACLSHFSIA